MKTRVLLLLLVLLATGASAFAEPGDSGEPVLPPAALAVRLDPRAPTPGLEEGLAKVGELSWRDEPITEDAEASASAALSASLTQEALPRAAAAEIPPRPCADVLRERRQVFRWIERTGELRAMVERRLRRAERWCRHDSGCDPTGIDEPLRELNAVVQNLRAYADREMHAVPDRIVSYRYRLDGRAGLALLREGWWPVGETSLLRARLYPGSWINLAQAPAAEPASFTGPPRALPDGTWLAERLLTATRACTERKAHRLVFSAVLQRLPAAPAADPQGMAVPVSGAESRTELVEGISL